MKWIFAVALLFSMIAFSQTKPNEVLAVVGSKKITLDEFNKKIS